MIHQFPNGLTVKQLKELLASWPDEDANGNDSEVWLESGIGLTSPAFIVANLNATDLVLEYTT